MGGQMGTNIQKPFVQLDAPTQTPAYIKAKLGDQVAGGQYVQPSANISKIAVNPHAKETSKAFVNAISNSKDYANKNLIETQGLRANTPVLSSIEDVLSQMGDNSLKNQKEKLKRLKVKSIEFSDSIFLCRNGTPAKSNIYDKRLYYYCDKIGVGRFSMHVLRHTFATRCIEAGMRPKTLQMILGHSDIGITMNLYVHVTDNEKLKELQNVESSLKII